MTYLTENPLPLAVTFFLLAAFFAWNAMRTGNKRTWQIAGAFAVLGVIPIVIDQLVETDREQVTTNLQDLAEAVVAGDVRRTLNFFEGGENVQIESQMKRVNVHEGLRIKQVKVDVDGSNPFTRSINF